MVVQSGGQIVVGGTVRLAGVTPVKYLARWDGDEWTGLRSYLDGPTSALAVLADGDMVAGGSFQFAATHMSPNFARLSFGRPCPADFDCNGGQPTVSDLFQFFALYFVSHPQADINDDGSVNVNDIYAFLTSFFAGCPPQ